MRLQDESYQIGLPAGRTFGPQSSKITTIGNARQVTARIQLAPVHGRADSPRIRSNYSNVAARQTTSGNVAFSSLGHRNVLPPIKPVQSPLPLQEKPYSDLFDFLMASTAIRYVDTATSSRPTANATPSTNTIIFSSSTRRATDTL
jgi:hypothetical protein